jgi:5-methylcytosine-specific restriction endonuclease McrA
MLLVDLEKKKFAATTRPRPGWEVVRSSRYIPAEVKRTVWERDGGRCAFVSRDGHRCTETGELEFHHCHPHGDGGLPTIGNIELRCRLCRIRHKRHYADHGIMPTGVLGCRESEGIESR